MFSFSLSAFELVGEIEETDSAAVINGSLLTVKILLLLASEFK